MRKWINVTVFVLLTALFAGSLPGQDLSKGVYWLAYDVKAHGPLRLCLRRSTNIDTCPEWNADKEFFRAGSVIRLEVVNGKFRSTFNVTVKGISITDFVPQVRGVATAPSASQPASPKVEAAGAPNPSPNPPVTLAPEFEDAYAQVKSSYDSAETNIATVEIYLGPDLVEEHGICSPRTMGLPVASAGEILHFVMTLRADAAVCDSKPEVPFTNENAFDDLTDRADRLIQSITLFNATIPPKSAIASEVNTAKNDFDTFEDLAKAFLTRYQNSPSTKEIDDSLNWVLGARQRLSKRMSHINDADQSIAIDIQKINNEMARSFAYINALYSNSASLTPFDIPLAQYSSSFAAQISIYEIPQTVAYAVTPAKLPTAGDAVGDGQRPAQPPAERPSPVTNPFPDPNHHSTSNPHPAAFVLAEFSSSLSVQSSQADPAVKPGNVKAPAPGDANQQNPATGKIVLTSGNFDVHKFYRGNLVAGFFASSLRNRQYGITNNGQSTSTGNLTYVTVIGPVTRPQYHAFVAIDLYPAQRDLYPPDSAFSPKWYRRSFVPALQVGYGVDALNNYLLGADWEMPFGLNISSGLHIGQETVLQPGIIPGQTQLPSGATAAPTTNKTKYGAYGSISFDLSTMKALIGSLFGGSNNVSSKAGQ